MRYSLVWARRAPNLVSTAVALFVFGWVPGGFAYNLGDPPPRTTTVGQPTRPTTAISTIEPGIIPHPTSASTAPSPPLTRRDAWIQSQQNIGSVTLAALLAGETTVPSSALALPISNNNNNNKKTIVITGSNSGIGFEACRRLALQGHTLVMACRTQDKAQRAVERLQEATTTTLTTARLIPAECDLASMQSIRSFADHLPILLETGLSRSSSSIDTLCLNAGLARNTAATDCARTLDGFELTVGTNHFGHFYLNHLLLPMMAKDGSIVVTASGVHDPESPGGAQGISATLGDLRGLQTLGKQCEMMDGGAFNADKAYKDSKLCNVLFTRELQRRLSNSDATKGIAVNCFNPGLIVGTGLFRDQNPVFTKLFDLAATNLFRVGESPEWGGAALEYMTRQHDTRGLFYTSPPGSSRYGDAAFGREFIPMPVSKEAQDDSKGKLLWDLSMQSLGLSAQSGNV